MNVNIKDTDKILFLDASSFLVQVGILSGNKWLGYFRSEEPALQSIFQGIEVCMQMAGLSFSGITGFAYCEGPGSLLGIRLVAMAIRGWKTQKDFKDAPVYAYNSFEVSLMLVKKVHNPEETYAVVSESRKGFWNILRSSENGKDGKVTEVSESDLGLLPGAIWLFKQKNLSAAEGDFQKMAFDYSLEECPEIFAQSTLLRAVDEPDALFVRETEYVKWDSKRHSLGGEK